MQTKIEIVNAELKAENAELKAENAVLKKQLASVGALGDAEKARLLEKILKEHPDIYTTLEFEKAFEKYSKD